MNPLVLLPIVLRLVAMLPQLLALRDNPAIREIIKIVQQFAGELFPDVEPPSPENTIEHIKWIQEQLNKHGANVAVDGIYGEQTRAAVKNFQRKYDQLDVDGYAGPLTVVVMKSL